jgi:hypothetical protein
MTPKMWFHGLVAAFIGGGASVISSGFALMIMKPDTFNLGPQLLITVKTVAVLGLFSGIQTAAAYLKQSPLWDGVVERRTITDSQVHTEEVTQEPTKTVIPKP